MKYLQMKNLSKLIFISIVAISLSSTAFADQAGDTTLSVKFSNQGTADSGGLTTTDIAGVPAVQTKDWNITTGATGTISSLIEDTSGAGSITTASLTFTTVPSATSSLGNLPFGDPRDFGTPPPKDPNARLAYGYLTGGSLTLTLNSLPTEFSNGFSLYIYAVNNQFSNETNTYTVDGGTPQTSTSNESGSYVVNHGYLVFSGLSGSTLTITDTDSGISSRTAIDGIELVANPIAAPEPSSYAMLFGGLLMLGCLVRRNKAGGR